MPLLSLHCFSILLAFLLIPPIELASKGEKTRKAKSHSALQTKPTETADDQAQIREAELASYRASVAAIDWTAKKKQRILVVAGTNQFIQSHYKFARKMAQLLAEQPFVDYVHLLVPLLNSDEYKKPNVVDEGKGKLRVQKYLVSEEALKVLPNFPSPEELEQYTPQLSRQATLGRAWDSPEKPSQLRLFRLKQVFLIFEVMAQDQELLAQLRQCHFTLGLAEWFHLGALQLFPLLDVHSHVMTRTLPMDTVFYEFLGLRTMVVHRQLPERRSLLRNGKKALEPAQVEGDHQEEWAHNWHFYARAEQAFTEIYAKAGSAELFASFRHRIRASKAHLLNLLPQVDFPQVDTMWKLNLFPSNVKFIGGIAVPTSVQAPNQATQDVFSSAKGYKGIVLISFGTVLKTEQMGVGMFKKFLKAISLQPDYLFVWKFEYGPKYEDPKWRVKMPKNVRLLKWLQQPSILAHPATVAFVSHCGANSLLETLSAGVPLVCVPVFSDQPYNAYAMEMQAFGRQLDIQSFTGPELADALHKVIPWKLPGSEFNEKLKQLRIQMRAAEQLFLETMRDLALNETGQNSDGEEGEQKRKER